jgi:hypothetical protein
MQRIELGRVAAPERLEPTLNQGEFSSKLYRCACCFVLFVVAASASFNGFFDKWHFREQGVLLGSDTSNPADGRFGIVDILNGTASRPFVYRQLLPCIANWFDRSIPTAPKDRLYNFSTNQGRLGDIMIDSPLAKIHQYYFRYLVLYAMTFLFTLLSVFGMFLVCRALNLPTVSCVFAPVLMILAIPYFMSSGGYFYDYPELAFLAIAAWMALKFDWWWMLPVVALATWNKESFVLMTLTLYPLLRARNSRIMACVGTCVLALTSSATYFALRSHYLQNPGSAVLVQWPRQLLFLLHPANLVAIEKTFGILAPRPFTLFPLILIVWTVRRGWHRLPVEARRHGIIAAAINLPLYFLFCEPGELRDLSMLYIVFMLLLAVNLAVEVKEVESGPPTAAALSA